MHHSKKFSIYGIIPVGVFVLFFIFVTVWITGCFHKRAVENLELAVGKEAESFALDETWNKYVNHQLGFSIKIPDKVAGINKCDWKEYLSIPVKIFEDYKNGTVYISPAYYYDDLWDEDLQESRGCKKVEYTLEWLQGQMREIVLRQAKPFLGWAVHIKTIKEEANLDEFIKESFGSACRMETKKLSENYGEGYYEVVVESGGMESDCPLNYGYQVLYSPQKNKAMSVTLGQEPTFFVFQQGDLVFAQNYDQVMMNSFRFE